MHAVPQQPAITHHMIPCGRANASGRGVCVRACVLDCSLVVSASTEHPVGRSRSSQGRGQLPSSEIPDLPRDPDLWP